MSVNRSSWTKALLQLVAFAVAFGVAAHVAPSLAEEPAPELRASVSQVGEAPVAVIAYLPDAVSNATRAWSLNAAASHDPDGNITSYLWTVVYGERTETFTRHIEPYPFEDPGLYKITLMVTDDDDNTAVAFTAVYSFADSDNDSMPDWWEIKYLSSITAEADGDPDEDGDSNLEEYLHGTDPMEYDADEAEEFFLVAHWRELAVIAAAVIAVSALVGRRQRRKRREEERRKIEYAIEIQKALDEE